MNLINGNCLDHLKTFPDNTFNLVLTSPPYNMNLRIRNGKYCSRQIVKELTTKYVDFPDNLSIDDYLNFNRQVITECLRVAPLVFYNVQFLTGNKVALFKLIGEFATSLKEIIAWDKVNCEPAIGELVLNSQFEVILVFDKFNAISRKFNNGNFRRGELSNHWSIKKSKSKDKSHGAVFPLELAHKVISNFSHPNDSILDPFMGAGTTGEACIELNRHFTGIELSNHYFTVASKRLSEKSLAFNSLKV